MQKPKTTNPYQFIEELLEHIKEELKHKPELKEATEEKLLALAERETRFALALIRKLEGNNKTTSKVVKYRKYLELLTKENRQPPTETIIKIKRLFLYLMNQSNNQPTAGSTEREKRFSKYDCRTNYDIYQSYKLGKTEKNIRRRKWVPLPKDQWKEIGNIETEG